MDGRKFNNSFITRDTFFEGVDKMPVGFFIYRADESEEILYVNKAILDLFECENTEQFLECTGGSFKGVVCPEDYELAEKEIEDQISKNPEHFDQINYRIKTRKGTVKYIEDYGYFFDDPDLGPIFYVYISTTYVHLDWLTQLPNMGYFLEIAKEKEKAIYFDGGQLVNLAFDFIGMKSYNSKFGYEEGNKLLIAFSKIIRRKFGNENCARFGEDHFYAFCDSENIENKLDGIIEEFRAVNEGRSLPIRIGIIKYDPEMSISVLCDRAKIAGKSRHDIYESGYVWFDEKMAEKFIKTDYIINHLDQALAEGWIKIYTQPVMRVLTGKLCNCEVLARWEDPKYGMISPGEFIPVLETNGLSYKLDIFVIRRVVELQQNRLSRGENIVPLSVNISRADFDICDPVNILVSELDSHGVRRNYICVEITESALINDSDVVRLAIERFHDEGIEVWMDDFGSGYSSLNVLKEFDFDEIKIDMIFLRNFNEKSKKIITDAVHMAKNLGIHVLAEGVETKEQLEFLKSVGCEKIQGYYFGKPQSITDTIRTLHEEKIVAESREYAEFYKKAGKLNVISDKPIALILYDYKDFKILYKNRDFVKALVRLGCPCEEKIEYIINDSKGSLSRKFRKLIKKVLISRETESITLLEGGNYFNANFSIIAESRQEIMLFVSMDKIYYDSEREQTERRISVFRSIADAFESIYIIDYVNDTRTVISSGLPLEKENEEIVGLKRFYDDYNTRVIHSDDLDRWHECISREGTKKRIINSKRGYFSDAFRIKTDDGSYIWTEMLVIAGGEIDSEKYIVCVRAAGNRKNERSTGEGLEPDKIRNAVLWENFINEANIKIFWKDKKRQFLGASRKFMEFYDFKSEKDFVGKTDEELGWHIDDSPYKNDELNVIKKGDAIIDSPGQNIVDGIIHYILASKFPIYENGEIVGLVGYAIDVNNDIRDNNAIKSSDIDPVTGLMNIRGLQDALSLLDDNYRTNGEDYTITLIKIIGYKDIKDDYGEALAKRFMKKCAEMISENVDSRATLSRVYGCEFALAGRNCSEYSLVEQSKLCVSKLKNIKEFEGRSCLLNVRFGMIQGSDGDSLTEVMAAVRDRMVNSESKTEKIIRKNNRMGIDMFDDIPMPYVIMRVVLDEKGDNAVDTIYEFVNQRYCEMTGYSEEDLIGKHYMKKFPYSSPELLDYGYRAYKGERVYGNAYDAAIGRYIRFVVAPASEKGCVAWLLYISDNEKDE